MNLDPRVGIGLMLSMFALAGGLYKLADMLLAWHRDFLYFMAEHEILVEDFADRKEISRHNVKVMAMASSAVRGSSRINGADKHR